MKNKKGFTLIELVIAIGLLSIFAITIGISLNRTLKSQKLKEQQDKINSIKSDHSGIEFGSQIRSYVLHPYSLIKDHRTNVETSNVDKVLDGNLDLFIETSLKRGL